MISSSQEDRYRFHGRWLHQRKQICSRDQKLPEMEQNKNVSKKQKKCVRALAFEADTQMTGVNDNSLAGYPASIPSTRRLSGLSHTGRSGLWRNPRSLGPQGVSRRTNISGRHAGARGGGGGVVPGSSSGPEFVGAAFGCTGLTLPPHLYCLWRQRLSRTHERGASRQQTMNDTITPCITEKNRHVYRPRITQNHAWKSKQALLLCAFPPHPHLFDSGALAFPRPSSHPGTRSSIWLASDALNHLRGKSQKYIKLSIQEANNIDIDCIIATVQGYCMSLCLLR